MAADIRLAILYELNKESTSAWQLAKKLKESEQLVRYHLKNFLKSKIVTKEGAQYQLINSNIFFFDGIAVMNAKNHLLFFGCPYHGKCPCLNIIGKECRLLRELPKEVRDLV